MSDIGSVEVVLVKDDDPRFQDLDPEMAHFSNGRVFIFESLWKNIKPMIDQLEEGKKNGRFP